MKINLIRNVFAVAALTFCVNAAAQHSAQHSAHSHSMPQTSAAAEYTPGEIRKVDKASGKITIRHEEIRSLDMPPMTMVFGVKDAALLDNLKAGDKIEFQVISESGALYVTKMRAGH